MESLGRIIKEIMIKIITGRVGERKIDETIEQYQSHIGEQEKLQREILLENSNHWVILKRM